MIIRCVENKKLSLMTKNILPFLEEVSDREMQGMLNNPYWCKIGVICNPNIISFTQQVFERAPTNFRRQVPCKASLCRWTFIQEDGVL
jgi:hypothetical protein